MGAKNSCAKGKVGELEWAAKLREEGYGARRGVQYEGGSDSPDVVCEALPQLHFEVKRTERLRIYDAIEQAETEKRDDQIAVVAHRQNHHPWLVVLTAADFFRLVRCADLNDAAKGAPK